jgi:TolB-like protein/Flp pilus assembly protein TadD
MEEILQALDRIDAHTRALPERSDKSIAALYFANLSENKEDEYFRDGMTEDIITELTKIREIQLLPRSAVLAYRDKSLPVSQVGQQLAVAYVLEGSLRRSGNRLRITAQLAETRTGRSIWAERYDRQLEDVFAIQDEIAQNIARALRVVLSDTEKRAIEKVPTRDIQAYDYYLRGRQAFFSLRRAGIEFARQMFARAIVIDPAYAAAFAGVANCCSFLYMFFEATQDNLREAMTASRRAVELDPESAEAHAARGLAEVFSKNYDRAEGEFQEAIRLNPRLFEAFYFYGRAEFARGRMEKAAELFRKASELDPADYQSIIQLENSLRALGRKDEARRAGEQAVQVIERQIQLEPGDARALYLGGGAALHLGDRERALDWTGRAQAIDPEETAVLYNVACTYTHLGEIDRALDLLETAVRNGFGHKEWLEHDPDFNPLRGHPRFQALVASMSKSDVHTESPL